MSDARSARRRILAAAALVAAPLALLAAPPADPPDHLVQQFLSHDDPQQHAYRAARRLEAQNGDRHAWLDAVTEFSTAAGFHYEITAHGGSNYLQQKVLVAVLEGERDVMMHGQASQSALAPQNYDFEPNGIDAEGLANILLSPKRKDRVLVNGTMFIRPGGGDLVRLEGRLAKSPSFWVKNVEIVKEYRRINGVVVPVSLEATAQTRFFGTGRMRMTYTYTQVDGRPLQ